jgi:hypothetical protein
VRRSAAGFHLSRRALAALLVGAAVARATAARAAERLRIRDLYAERAEFSAKATGLNGQLVEIQGFMAPPLKAEADFFVLTKLPMAVCPFCDSELDWPTDIVLVRLARRQDWAEFNQPIVASGRLELGTEIDEGTGFVSRVRLVDARYELA